VSSRRFAVALGCLACVTAIAGATGGASAAKPAADTAAAAKRGQKTRTPIKHFVTLMQQNRSFDHYFGTYPGADGIPAGVCVPVNPERPRSNCVKPFHLGDRVVRDVDHNAAIFSRDYRGGRMDGFIHAIRQSSGRVEPSVVGHYDEKEIPYYWNVADEFVLFDRFFTSAAAGSLRNAMYWVTGTPGNYRDESIPDRGFRNLPTIFDRLQRRGISWKFYVQNYNPAINFLNRGSGSRGSQLRWIPLLNFERFLADRKLNSHIVDLDEYFLDLERGTLPSVSYIVAPSGGSSEHAPGNFREGQRFVTKLINSLMRSEYWKSSAFMWSYDGWGGWYDHVKPPRVDRFGYGFRVPALLVSAFARRGYVDSTTMDSTSILKFIEQNWHLASLASRDRKANTFLGAFDFNQAPRKPRFPTDRNKLKKPTPNRLVIYGAYLGAVVLAGLLVAWATLGWTLPVRELIDRSSTRRRRR
jgi:phospholipase C